jgi:tetratricopeptide (TPR) repeat protein
MAFMEAGNLEQSRSTLSRLFEIAPCFYKENEVVCYNIGMIYAYSKEVDKAIEYFKIAIHIEPDYSPAKKMLSRLSQGGR